jgi:selenocysteine-specific elongation factor
LEIRPAARKPLKNNSRIRLFVGTSEILGRVILLEEKDSIAPKERALAQIVTEEPATLLVGDRFVIRDETNVRTLGGGVVLNPLGRRSRKPLDTYRRNLVILRDSAGPDVVEALVNLQESLALPAARLACLMNRPVAEVETAVRDARFIKLSMGDEEGFTTRSKWEELKTFALAAVKAHHASAPLSSGLEMESLRTRLPFDVSARAFRCECARIPRDCRSYRARNRHRSRRERSAPQESQGETWRRCGRTGRAR